MRRYLCAPKRQRGAGARGPPTPPTEAPQSCLRERTWRRTGGEAPSSSCRSEVLREGGGAVSCHLGRPQPAGADTPQQPALAGGGGGHSVGPAQRAREGLRPRHVCLRCNPAPSAEGVLVKEIQRGGGQALLRVGKGEERAAGREQPRSSQQQTQRKPPLRAASAHSPHVAVERALSGPLPATSLAGPGRVEIFSLSSRKSEGVSRSHSGLLAIGSQSSGILRWDHVEAHHQSQPIL